MRQNEACHTLICGLSGTCRSFCECLTLFVCITCIQPVDWLIFHFLFPFCILPSHESLSLRQFLVTYFSSLCQCLFVSHSLSLLPFRLRFPFLMDISKVSCSLIFCWAMWFPIKEASAQPSCFSSVIDQLIWLTLLESWDWPCWTWLFVFLCFCLVLAALSMWLGNVISHTRRQQLWSVQN